VSYIHTTDEQATLLRWAAERIGQDGWIADSEAMGVLEADTGRIRAVGVINNYHDQGAWVHFATAGATPRPLLANLGPFFAYAFQIRNLERITARIAVDNLAAQVFALRLGFEVEGRERCGFRGRDLGIYCMLRRDCTWLMED
jgi:hypothetical protein